MQIFPSTGLEIIEFDKVLELISSWCLSDRAKTETAEIAPSTNAVWIADELRLVKDAMDLMANEHILLDRAIDALHPALKNLEVKGYVLSGEELVMIRGVLSAGAMVYEFFASEEAPTYKALGDRASQIPDPTEWLNAINAILDEEGDVRDDASPVLVNIAREMNAKRTEGDRLFRTVVRKYNKDGWLADTLESVRNDRRVLAVKSEYKRKIRGIVHDQSATGRTAFVEPEEVIGLNNDLFELRASRQAEVYRLLGELCEQLRPYADDIAVTEEVLIDLDLIFAKARFARSVDGTVPELVDGPNLGIKHARHPLLLLKNSQEKKETVPFDLALHGNNALLLLSGPNAGGKSILMKSVGLLQVMVQSGIPVPVDASSQFGVFSKFCVELGDRQSIENDLSTYSSRLVDMKKFLEVADGETLLLIDEFGSGTDPNLGGAIAEGILDRLHRSGCYGVLTTHYAELKVYAYKTKGVLNGAMIFDREEMAPTYKLKIGKPGSSFTFEIAEKTGLPKSVLKYARHKAGRNDKAMEDLLGDLENKTNELERRLRDVRDKEKNVDRLMESYDKMRSDLSVQRKRFKLEQKERDYQHLSQLNKELEKAVREARESKKVEDAKRQLEKVKRARKEARSSIQSINEKLTTSAKQDTRKEWAVGDPVKVAGGTHAGKIERIDRKQATVIIGQLRMNVPIKDLIPAGDPLEINPSVSITRDVQQSSGFNNLLDLRGMRVHEAAELLEKFMDEALLADAHMLRIVHGKGTGALKKMVEKRLREYPVTDISQPEDQQGGSGSTIVTL